VLENCGRDDEAAAIYFSVLNDVCPRFKSEALAGLTRVSEHARADTASALMDAANLLERAGRWEDSEALYQKVIATGSNDQRSAALRKLKAVADIRSSIAEEHLLPPWNTFITGLVSGTILVLLIVCVAFPFGRIVKWISRRRQKNHLSIGSFGVAGDMLAPGRTFGDTLSLMYENMRSHSRPRTIVGDAGKMPVLLGSSSSVLLDLVGSASDSLLPLTKWLSTAMFQPGYRISGWTEATWWEVKVCAKLEHLGGTIRQWSRTYPLQTWFRSEQELAYEIVVSLKEYSDAHAA
jgi:hypothetical protein